MNVNTSKEKSFYTQGQQFAARVLFIVWLLASGSPESTLAAPKHQSAMVPATTTSPGDPSLTSTPPTPGDQLPSDSPGSFWGGSVASSPSIDAALQERMSQEAAPDKGRNLLRTSPKVTPVGENLPFEARGGESVRFHCQMGQWRAEVSSHLGTFSRRAVLPVVCSSGEDIASNLEVLSRYPRWYSQRQIHVLDRNVCPTLGEVVYVGELGLKGGGEGEASGSGEQRDEHQTEATSHPVRVEQFDSFRTATGSEIESPTAAQGFEELESFRTAASSEIQIPTSPHSPTNQESGSIPSTLVDQLKALASDPQIDQHPDKLAELGEVLLKLAASKQEEAGDSAEDLSAYTEAAILYQHVLSICEQKAGILGSQEAPTLEQSAYQGLAQIEISMLGQATGAEAGAITPSKPLPARIAEDKQRLGAIRTKAREEAKRLAAFRDKQGTAEEVRGAEAVYIEGSKKLFEDIAKEIKSVLGDFYQEGEQALGPPPCKYAIMGVGSIALQQTTPYSDLEFAILMEDAPQEATAEVWRVYFRRLTHLVHFRVINLGETVLPFSEYKVSLDHLGRKGLNFDLGGKTPLGRKDKDYELIQPVEGMMEYLKNKDNKMEQMDKLLPFVLERTCYIYGDQKLHDNYLAAQKAFWSSCQDAAGKHAYQERMRKVLLEGITELDQSQPGVVKAGRKQAGDLRTVGPKLHPEDAGRLYDVKQEIYRLPDRLLYGLATYYGLRPESAWDAVKQLEAKGIIGVSEEAKQAAHRLQYAVSFATMLRLATYIRYGEQKETLSGSASSEQTVSEFFALPKEALQENGSLFKYYYTALALHSEMEEFFELLNLRLHIQTNRALRRSFTAFRPGGKYTVGQEKAHFSSSGFYDTSCAVKIAIYNRLLHYEQAAKCAEDHLEKVKAGYNQKKLARYHHNVGVSYYHLGRFDQSFDHFRSSLDLLKALYPNGDPQVAEVLRSLGIAHYNLSEFQESLKHFKRSLEMLQGLYREKHPETAEALGSVGAAHEQLDNFQESLEYKQQALEMLQALYPEKDPEVARALLSLGDAYAATGQLEASRDQKEDSLAKFQQSLQHKQEALEMFKDLCGKSHPEIARVLLSLGESYALDGKLAASLEHKQEALEMLQALYRSSHPEVARALLSLGESYALSGKLEESEDLKDQSWKMFQVFYDENHPEVVRALGSLNETRGSLIQEKESSKQDPRPSLRSVRTAHPQHLTLLPTPKHGKESAEENTLLRNYYSKTDFSYVKSLFEEHRSKHVKDLQCQLMLREQKLVKQEKEAAGDREDQVASHHMRLEEVKTPIRLGDLFKDRSIRPDKPIQAVQRILLTGDPGTGKTTLSRQLAYQWSVGAWGQEFDDVYLLPVRSLQQSEYDGTRYNREKTLSTAIVNTCFSHDLPATEAEYNRLRAHIDQEIEKSTILVILDGLDERAGASEEILRQAQAGSHKLLMLSRPYGIDAEQRLAEIEIEHAGFNPEQLKAYVQEEVPDGKLAAELLGYIQQYTNIREIAHIPVNLQILCALWKDEDYGVDREELQQGSLPELYQLVTDFTWQRYTKKFGLVDECEEEVFDTLGQIALAALEQGEVLISPGLVHQQVKHAKRGRDKLKAKLKDAGFLLLSYVGKDQEKQEDPANQSGFYQFPHLTFQEYFAGRTLARYFLSKDEDEQEKASDFLAEHQYEAQYGRTLSFMAGEVSKIKGVEGIKKLLSLLGESDQEIVGLQHLLLQLRVVHEWLCMATEREVERGMAALEQEFQVLALLRQWFTSAFGHVRLEGYKEGMPGHTLLALLKGSLQTFGSIARHAPGLLALFKQAAQGPDGAVRLAAVSSLGEAMAGASLSSSAMLETMADDDNEAYAIQRAARTALREAKGDKTSEEDEGAAVRGASQESLGKAMEAVPQRAQAIIASLSQIYQDWPPDVRKAAEEFFISVREVAPSAAPGMLNSVLLQAYSSCPFDVRSDIQELFRLLTEATHGEYSAIIHTLLQVIQDESAAVRGAFQESLGEATEAIPQEAQAMLQTLLQRAKDAEFYKLEDAIQPLREAVSAASQVVFRAMLSPLLQGGQDWDCQVRAAAVQALLAAPLAELLEHYWYTSDSRLLPYITPRLYHTPLLVGKRVLLYAAAGPAREWRHPQGVLSDFTRQVQDQIIQMRQLSTMLPGGIDKSVWEQYFGAVGEAPLLPTAIAEILNSPCPFWRGKQVKETHLLALIPSEVAGQPLTLDYLEELTKRPQAGYGTKYRFYWDGVREAIGYQSPESSYWVLMTRDVLPGSREKSYEAQCALVADHTARTGLAYEPPGALEAAVVTLLHHARSGERLYSDHPVTYTSCREKDKDGYPVIVGGFSSGGFLISYGNYGYNDAIGLAGLRKF